MPNRSSTPPSLCILSWIAAATVVATPAATATAATAPPALRGERPLVVAHGAPARAARDVSWAPPHGPGAAALAAFTARYGRSWRALWDAGTGVPLRLFGEGLAAPGAVRSARIADAIARRVLREHIDLLAPGATEADFELAANDLTGALRSVGYHQVHAGMRVLGGHVSFRFKNDRLFVLASTAFPHVDVAAPRALVAAAEARRRAAGWIEKDFPNAALTAGAVEGPFVLPVVRPRRIDYYAVLAVDVASAAPLARWRVYVDAETGVPVAREQTLRFASGQMSVRAPVRWWGGGYADYPAADVDVTIDGAAARADSEGRVTWSGAGTAQIAARARSAHVRVFNDAGADIERTFSLADGGALVWDESDDEYADAQLTALVHGYRVKQWARTVSSIGWLDEPLIATVNIADTCNAFSDGTTINFFRSGNGCGNTGRIADIVYHEFGHSLHNHALIDGVGSWDGALSEGLSDFVAATITGDPRMGPGFFGDDRPLRHCDPDGYEHRWPEDRGEIHHTGKIYCGTMFDLRKAMIATLGEVDGVAFTDKLFYESFRRADDIPSTYVEALAWDDDDGNLANGTPHQCEIDAAYAAHGMATPDGTTGPRVRPPRVDGRTVTLPVLPAGACPAGEVVGATLYWELRGEPGTGGSATMAKTAGAYEAELPDAPFGSVIRYRIEFQQADGTTHALPANPADPMYEQFVGEVTPLYCTDFETDPAADGWEHGLSRGEAGEGADDWQWGVPAGAAGDPRAAHSGQRVYGNDLGGDGFNGEYQSDKTNYLRSPAVDTRGYDHVRLQYRRWLRVEQGLADRATIYADGDPVWSNLADGQTHHLDAEWRFHDVDLTAAAADGTVQVTFELDTDSDGTFGGWTIDDVCIVGYNLPACGNGVVEAGEACDDGNADDADGCRSDCTVGHGGGDGGGGGGDDGATGPDPTVVGGCGCNGGGAPGGAWLAVVGYALARRRRRASA